MTWSHIKNVGFVFLILSALLALACHKNVAAPPPAPIAVTPAPPPPPAPTITLRAQPGTIDRGASATLQWEARNAATVTITPEVGNVPVTGNRSVSPTSSVNYMATATGPGGTASDVARVTVNVPVAPPRPPEPPRPRPPDLTTEELLRQNVTDIFFDYDKADIKPDQVSILQNDANWLKANPSVRFTIEGHCDERGSEEYNLGLGDRRANRIKEFLLSQGVPSSRMNTISYGEERPICHEQTERCYAMNRRAHFAPANP